MDLRIPEVDGIEAIEQIRQCWPHSARVILTTSNEDALLFTCSEETVECC
jgi:NarL family two-component system response regulator YdfI